MGVTRRCKSSGELGRKDHEQIARRNDSGREAGAERSEERKPRVGGLNLYGYAGDDPINGVDSEWP
jgi:hypothetical protein